MNTYLEYQLEQEKSQVFKKFLSLLLSNKKEAQNILKWLKVNARKGIKEIMNHNQNNNCLPCTDWEAELLFLLNQFVSFQPLNSWEKAPSESRLKHSNNVANLARNLADAMEETPAPFYPPVLELFDDDRAIDILLALYPREERSAIRFDDETNKWIDANGNPIFQNPSYRLAGRFIWPDAQFLPSILRRLADFSEKKAKEPKRDQRPNRGQPDARAFTRQLANYFELFHKRNPNEIILACVMLMFPDIDPIPDESTIRAWRGRR